MLCLTVTIIVFTIRESTFVWWTPSPSSHSTSPPCKTTRPPATGGSSPWRITTQRSSLTSNVVVDHFSHRVIREVSETLSWTRWPPTATWSWGSWPSMPSPGLDLQLSSWTCSASPQTTSSGRSMMWSNFRDKGTFSLLLLTLIL